MPPSIGKGHGVAVPLPGGGINRYDAMKKQNCRSAIGSPMRQLRPPPPITSRRA